MKKISRVVGSVTFAVIVGAIASFAWIEVASQVAYSGLNVRLAESDDSVITISDTKTSAGSVKLRANSTMEEMIPCTTEDGKNFYNESGNKITGCPYILEKGFYIHTKEMGKTVHIEDIELSNGNQEIADSLRCAVTICAETKVIEPTSDDYGGTFGNGLALSTSDPNYADIKVYFEGTDDSCTAENINDMDAIGVTVILGAD